MTAPVAIAVVSWNTRELLEACLRSMREDAEEGIAEVWVVDNASSDGSAALVAEAFPWVKLLALEENIGFGPAVNRVAERTDAAWIAAANADIELAPRALERLVTAGESDLGTGAVAPRLVLPDGSIQPSLGHFPSLRQRLAFHLRLYRLDAGLGDRMLLERYWDPERPRLVDWATGAFVLVRRRAFEQVGGFDERQWMYAEDLDLCWRLARAGWDVRYEPTARVRHELSPAARKAFGDEERLAARWMASSYGWMVRRRGLAFTWAYAGLDMVEALARVAVLTLPAWIAPDRFDARRRRAQMSARLFRRGLRSRRTLLGQR